MSVHMYTTLQEAQSQIWPTLEIYLTWFRFQFETQVFLNGRGVFLFGVFLFLHWADEFSEYCKHLLFCALHHTSSHA